MTTLDTLRKAQEALEWCVAQGGGPQCEHESGGAVCFCKENAAITALRAEIERLEAVEPVAEVYNPWRHTLENCASGDNYLRHSEYHELIKELDDLYRLRAVPPAAIPALTAEETACELARQSVTQGHTSLRAMARWAYALAAERAGAKIE